jgi:hypothetical protein
MKRKKGSMPPLPFFPRCTVITQYDEIQDIHTTTVKQFHRLTTLTMARFFVNFRWRTYMDANEKDMVRKILSFENVEFGIGYDPAILDAAPGNNLAEVIRQKTGKEATIDILVSEIISRCYGASYSDKIRIGASFRSIFNPPRFVDTWK